MSAASAQALLRTLGGDAVTVRFAAAPAGGDGEELGLASPEFRDVVLRPVLVRIQAGRLIVLVDAATAEATLESADVQTVLLSAAFVSVLGENMRVHAVERRAFFGRAYLYRMLLATEGKTQ